jgi:hypothetical protein
MVLAAVPKSWRPPLVICFGLLARRLLVGHDETVDLRVAVEEVYGSGDDSDREPSSRLGEIWLLMRQDL